jgi:hypothetical protein
MWSISLGDRQEYSKLESLFSTACRILSVLYRQEKSVIGEKEKLDIILGIRRSVK